MKYLILTLSLASFGVLAQTPATRTEIKEISDKELGKKAVAVIKDAEIDKQLGELSVFKSCRDDNKFKPDATQAEISVALDKAVICFKSKIGKGSEEKLKEMSEKLNLQNYGLIPSQNVKEITKYLGDKMYKSMTGVDKKDNDLKATIASMRFNNRKMVDQRDFIDLYKNQLVKSALFEISRFCFEDFREQGNTSKEFAPHWSSFFANPKAYSKPIVDTGANPASDPTSPGVSFFPVSISSANVYTDIMNGISTQGSLTGQNLSDFFSFCTEKINPLCTSLQSKQALAGDPTSKAATLTGATSIGSKACLTQSRLREIRKAIANTEKVIKEFDSLSSQDMSIALDKLAKPIQFYDGSKGQESLDSLTNYSSHDIIEGGANKNSKLDDLAKKCAQNASTEDCKAFLTVDDSLEKAQYSLEMDMRLKREITLERVKALAVKDQKSVKEYLTTEGFLDILEAYEKNPSPANLENLISQNYEARRIAALEALKQSMGKRQISETDAKATNAEKNAIVNNINNTKDERARLAQVVMFNNIITSNIGTYDSNNEFIGKNRNAWLAEEKGLKKSNIQAKLFQNLKQEVEDEGGSKVSGNFVMSIGLLDNIIGKSKTSDSSKGINTSNSDRVKKSK